jgi:hypothetical protein
MKRHVLLIGTLAVAAAANAEERDPLDAKLIVDAGMFFLSTDMRVQVNGETAQEPEGSDVNYDDTFGIGNFDRFRADGLWRFADRHSVEATYFQNNRSATRSLDRDVEFKGQLYPVGVDTHAQSDLTIAELSYGYAFMRNDQYELAATVGVHYLDIKLKLDATVMANGQTNTRNLDTSASTSAPLPVVGLRGVWKLPHNMYIDAHAQYLYINYDPYKGRLVDLKASFVWQCTDHVGIGVGYDDFRFRFDITDRPKFDGSLKWNYGGALAFATVMF